MCDNPVGQWLNVLDMPEKGKLHPCFLHWALKHNAWKYDIEKLFGMIYQPDLPIQEFIGDAVLVKLYKRIETEGKTPALQRELLHIAFSRDKSSHFWSFCTRAHDGSMGLWVCDQDKWHCYVCKKCEDNRTWHCADCNRCSWGIGTPCENCGAWGRA